MKIKKCAATAFIIAIIIAGWGCGREQNAEAGPSADVADTAAAGCAGCSVRQSCASVIRPPDTVWTSGYTWAELSGGTLTVNGKGGMADHDMGKNSPPWIHSELPIVSVVIEEGVTSIGALAFYGLPDLKYVTIGNSVKNIGVGAFYKCSGLISIDVAAGNDSYVSDDGILFNKSKTELIRYPSGRPGAYIIPGSVKTIWSYAFSTCMALTSVTIPASVTYIDNEMINFSRIDRAFGGCSNLISINVDNGNPAYRSVDGVLFNKAMDTLIAYPNGKQGAYTVPGSVKAIGIMAFGYCNGLTSVTISGSVRSIGRSAFTSCSGLMSVTIENGVKAIGDFAFNECKNLMTVTIPNSVRTIGMGAFFVCSNLDSVTIPGSVTTIEREAFALSGLRSVTIGSGVKTIGDMAFLGCENLMSVSIPSGVQTIGYDAFDRCSNLTSVTFPASLRFIGDDAFGYCNNLVTIISLNPRPPKVEGFMCRLISTCLYVPEGSIDAYRAAEGWAFDCIKPLASAPKGE